MTNILQMYSLLKCGSSKSKQFLTKWVCAITTQK